MLICFALLYVQAMSELELPTQMSMMVDTGIQAGGIEPGAPEVISAEGMNFVLLFSEEDDTILAAYTFTSAGSASAKIEKKFLEVKTRDTYVLTSPSEAADNAYNTAVYLSTLTLQAMAEQSLAQSEGGAVLDVDISKLYQMTPILEQMLAQNTPSAEELDDVALNSQMLAQTFNGLFYRELGADLDSIRMNYILFRGAMMLGIALLGVAMAVIVGWFSSKISSSVSRKLRRDVFEKVGKFSNAEFDKFSTASLITRTTNDISQVQMLMMMGIRIVCYVPIMGIGGVFKALASAPSMSWIIALTVVVLALIMGVGMVAAMPKFQILQKLIDKLNLVSRENLSGMMVIRAFGNEDYEEQRFEQANGELRGVNLFTQRLMAVSMPIMSLIMNFVILLIVWTGANGIASSTMQIGGMMAFMQYAMQIIMSVMMIMMMFIMVPRALVAAGRINEILDTELEIENPTNPKAIGSTGVVEFKNVHFRYTGADEDMLYDINFTANPGETTAIIGSTGSGKSTLINLIPRFYDVTHGSVTFDGVDVRELDEHALRDKIGYIPQKGHLFSGSVDSNLRLGKESAADSEIAAALETAQASGFVSEMENGVHAEISQGGTNVSGGQRQRLAIARALTKSAPVYIFDDSFSALDLKTDAALRKALKTGTENATIIIVAQRVSTIMSAEQILVLDHGRIVGKGTHSELLTTCPEYMEIAESQLSPDELKGGIAI